MAIDIKQGYSIIEKKIETTQKYNQISTDIQNLKKRAGSSLEESNGFISEQLSSAKQKVDKFQTDYQKGIEKNKSQFDKLLDITNILSSDESSSGNSRTIKYLKKIFVKTIDELKPQIKNILNELSTKAIGCSENQEFIANQSIYLKVQSIDYSGLLKQEPTSNVGKITYEKNDISYNSFPFSMNKELYNRTQNINQPYSIPATSNYIGKSTQELFDITYVESYIDPISLQVINGNFFKIDLKPRQSNLVTEFMKDYYDTIEIFDIKNLFSQLMNQLTGAVSIQKGDGDAALSDWYKVLLVIKRFLGICYDSTKEINVSGVAKISETNNINESYFEFDEVDLRLIEQQISDLKLGVVEFEECDTVKLSVDSLSIVDAVNNINFSDGGNNNNQITDAADLTDVVTNGFFPTKINIDVNFLREFPKALIMSILSPKVMLPIMTIAKSINKGYVDQINSYVDMAKNLSTFFSELVSRVAGLFMKILFDIVVKDIKALIKRLYKERVKERYEKYSKIILSLTTILTQIADIVKDVRECKSVINKLQSLLNNVQTQISQIPLPLLLAARLRKGFSKTNAFLNVIKEFEALGLPTGPMPDGSPNLQLAAVKAIIDGIDDEMSENGRSDFVIPPLTVSPLFATNPITWSGVPV